MKKEEKLSRRQFLCKGFVASLLPILPIKTLASSQQDVASLVKSQPLHVLENPLRFNGMNTDIQIGMQHLGNGYRAYWPAIMRFNSMDSMSPFDKGGINAYGYVSGDPLNYTDPTGHAPSGIKRSRSVGDIRKLGSLEKMDLFLKNSNMSTKIDSGSRLSRGDLVIRTANGKLGAHRDLSVHSSMLFVDSTTETMVSFRRVEMVEGGGSRNLVSASENHNIYLILSDRFDSKPYEYFNHGQNYKIRIPSTGRNILSTTTNTYQRFSMALRDEAKFLKKHLVYGIEQDGIGNYNCNTFVSNVLMHAVGSY